MARELPLRRVSAELRARWRDEGLWTDDTLGALVDASVRAHSALTLRIWSERRPFSASLSSVHEQARRLAAGLRARDLGPGDVVAFQLPNWAEAVATFLGLALLGVVDFPRTPSGKIQKFVLRDRLRSAARGRADR